MTVTYALRNRPLTFATAAGQFLAEALVHADRDAFARRVWALIGSV